LPSGYGPPLPCLRNYSHELYLSCRTSSWAGQNGKIVGIKLIGQWIFLKILKKKLIKKFEQGGDDLFRMLELNFLKKNRIVGYSLVL
jgi:hypothetical protein